MPRSGPLCWKLQRKGNSQAPHPTPDNETQRNHKVCSIPIVRATGGLKDSVRDSGDGEGNGFVFQNYDAEDMYYAICRALEGFALHDDWQVLVSRAMLCNNSWERSANDYMKLYRTKLKE